MSWKPAVEVGGTWNRNGLVFATKEEALLNAADRYARWTLCTGYRAVESDEAPNYDYTTGKLLPISGKAVS